MATTTGVIISHTDSGFNCSNVSNVTGFSLDYYMPTGTEIYCVFNTGSGWGFLDSSGTLKIFQADTLSFDVIKNRGNTPSSLAALSNIPDFVGKFVRIAVGLASTDITKYVPQIRLTLKVSYASQKLSTSVLSPVYALNDDSQIASITADTSKSGTGSVSLLGRYVLPSGAYSDWSNITSLNAKKAVAIQLKADLAVTSLNSGSASITAADVFYSDRAIAPIGQADTEIFSVSKSWKKDINQARISVKHSILQDNTDISCAVSFRHDPTYITGEALGTGSGSKQTFQLKHPKNVRYDSVKLFFNGSQVLSGFDINTQAGRISCTAPAGYPVTCNYEADWEAETWHNMTLLSRLTFDDFQLSEYAYYSPEDFTPAKFAAVKISLASISGNTTKEFIGLGHGYSAIYQLAHPVKDGSITIFANSSELSRDNYCLLDDPKYIRIAASKGVSLYASYSWISNSQVIHHFTSVFSD